MMFCSKCGAQLPDGTKFCPKCGNQISAAPAADKVVSQAATKGAVGVHAKAPNAKAPSAHTSAPALSAARLAPVVLSVVAAIFACMPWVTTSSYLLASTGVVGGFAGFLTSTDASNYSFAETYNAWQFGEAGRVFDLYEGTNTYETLFGVISLAWIICMVLLVVGVILTLVNGKRGVLRLGLLGLAAVAAISGFFCMATEISSSVLNPLVCAAACVAGLLVSGMRDTAQA